MDSAMSTLCLHSQRFIANARHPHRKGKSDFPTRESGGLTVHPARHSLGRRLRDWHLGFRVRAETAQRLVAVPVLALDRESAQPGW